MFKMNQMIFYRNKLQLETFMGHLMINFDFYSIQSHFVKNLILFLNSSLDWLALSFHKMVPFEFNELTS